MERLAAVGQADRNGRGRRWYTVSTKPAQANHQQRSYICNDDAIDAKLCNGTHKGEWILADDADSVSKMYIRTEAVHLNDPKPINYPVASGDRKLAIKTGYYCVATAAYTKDVDYEAIITFRNA